MQKGKPQIVGIILVLALLSSVLPGCGKGDANPKDTEQTTGIPTTESTAVTTEIITEALTKEEQGNVDGAEAGTPEVVDMERPIVFETTWKVSPGDAIGIYGTNFQREGAQTSAYLAPMSGYNGTDSFELYELNIVSCDDGVMLAEIPTNIPADNYIGYIKCGDKLSEAFYVNTPELDWLSDIEICAGLSVRVFGRNLLNPKTGTVEGARLYVCSKDGIQRLEAEITAATEYTVDFIVPKGIEEWKQYTIQYNNGACQYGLATLDEEEGAVGMSDAQLKELEALYGVEVAWASKLNLTDVFNVKDYGAVGDGKTDDREAFQEALNTAAKNGGGIVYLPEGTYHMGNATTGVSIPNGIIVAGDGQDKTVIMTDQKFSFEAFYGGIARLTLQSDLKRPEDDEERRTSGYVGPLLYSGSGTCFFAKEVTVKAADGCGFRGQTSRQIVIEDCSFEVTHNGLNVLGCRSRIRGNYVRNTQRAIMAFGTYSWVDGNVFDGANGGDDCEKVYSGRYAGQVNTMEHRICDMEGDKLYYGNNTIIGMIGDAREDKEDNCGEGILNQESARIAISTVTSTGENTLTADLDFNAILEGNDPYAGKNGTKLIGARIYLVSGKGMGQRRSIIGVLGNTLLLDSEWDYPPQEGDSFMINAGVPERNIIVNNDIQAETRKGGIMYYGCSYDNIIADNTMTNGGGIWFGQAQNSSQARTGLSYFNYVDGNFLSGGIPAKNVSARENTLTIGPGDDGGCGITLDPILPELTAYYGNLYRNNTIEGNGTDIEASGTYNAKFVVHNGINVATVSEETLDYNKGTIVANNTVTNSMNGVSVSSLSNFTLLYQNNFTGNKVNYNDTGSRNLVTMNGEKLAEQTAPVDSEAVGIAAVISDLE